MYLAYPAAWDLHTHRFRQPNRYVAEGQSGYPSRDTPPTFGCRDETEQASLATTASGLVTNPPAAYQAVDRCHRFPNFLRSNLTPDFSEMAWANSVDSGDGSLPYRIVLSPTEMVPGHLSVAH